MSHRGDIQTATIFHNHLQSYRSIFRGHTTSLGSCYHIENKCKGRFHEMWTDPKLSYSIMRACICMCLWVCMSVCVYLCKYVCLCLCPNVWGSVCLSSAYVSNFTCWCSDEVRAGRKLFFSMQQCPNCLWLVKTAFGPIHQERLQLKALPLVPCSWNHGYYHFPHFILCSDEVIRRETFCRK